MRGGYQIIDLSKDPFISGTSKTVAGSFYKAVKGNNRKPIVLSGIALKASTLATPTLYDDEIVVFSGDTSSVSGTMNDGTTVSITNADAVTVTLGE